MTNDPIKTFLWPFIKYIIVIFGPSLLVIFLYQILDPSAFRDGQFILAFILSVPAGVILGIGLFISNQLKKRNGKAMWPLMLSGLAVIIICLALAYFSASSRGLNLPEFVSTAVSPWCIVPLIFGIVVTVAGLISLMNSHSE